MLMEQARKQRGGEEQGSELKKPDYRQFTPPEILDDVERIVAAGVKLMYSPEMRQELQEAVTADMPVDQKLADNTAGLLLTLDQQAPQGLPVAALFPAGMGLLGEAAEVLQAAGQRVTQEDWNDAALRMFVIIGKKLGGSDEQIMQAAQQWVGQGGQGGEGGEAPAGPAQQPSPAGGAPAQAQPEEMPEDEEAAMARGMQ